MSQRNGKDLICSICAKIFYRPLCLLNKPNYCSKKCAYKGISKSGRFNGSNNPSWKGNKASYSAIHIWLKNNFGKAYKCENAHCLKKSHNYNWSLLKGKTYEQKRENFIMLCRICHIKYDWNDKWRKNISKSHLGQRAWNKGIKTGPNSKHSEFMKNYWQKS